MFKLSRLTDYGVVVLGKMAQNRGEMATAPDLADTTTLPQPTVAKILKLLAREGVLTSHRGTNGGYALDRDPSQITIAEVIAALDGPVALTACVDGVEGRCGVENLCPMRGRWDKLNSAVRGALESVTLAEIIAADAPPDFIQPSQGEEDNRATGTPG